MKEKNRISGWFISIFISLIIGFLPSCISQTPSASRRPYRHPPALHHMSLIDGTSYRFTVSEDVLTNSPAYNPHRDPPLSVSEAIALAEGEASQYIPEEESWNQLTLESVELLRFRNTDKWYYVVNFTPLVPFVGENNIREMIRIPVLFTGEVIQGEVSEW